MLLGLLILFVLLPTFATDIKWSWTTNDSRTSYYRYQLNGEDDSKWTVVGSTVTNVVLPAESGTNRLYLQASNNGVTWSSTAVGTYLKEKDNNPLSLRLNFSPYSGAVYFFFNGREIDGARTDMGTVYGLSVGLELDWNLFSSFRVYPELGYALAVKAHTTLPKEYNVHYIKAGAGCDYLVGISEKTDVYFGLLGGAVIDINNNEVNKPKGYFGIRAGFETKVTDNFYLGFMSRVTGSLYIANDYIKDLYTSLTLLIDPASLSLRYEF